MQLKRRKLLAGAVEAVSGTPETLAAEDAAYNVYNVTWSEDIPINARDLQGSLGQLAGVPGARAVKITFDAEMTGAGVADDNPAWATTFLAGCGMVLDTNTFSPTSNASDMSSLTIAVYEEGVRKLATGCMGNVVFNFESGKYGLCSFEFTGVYAGVTDTATLGVTHPSVLPPRVAGGTFTIGAYTPIVSKVTINMNNEVTLRQSIATDSAYISAVITGRKPSGEVDPEQTLVATKNYWGAFLAGTEAALVLNIGTTQYNKISITAPKLQYSKIGEGDRNGLIVLPLGFQMNIDPSGDDNDIAIEFGQA